MRFCGINIRRVLSAIILAAALLYSCSPADIDFNPNPSQGRTEEDDLIRIPGKGYRNVFIMYSMGFNDLRGYLTDDINEFLSSQLMESRRDIVFILSHIAPKSNSFPYFDASAPVAPTLTKVSRDIYGNIQKDTLDPVDSNLDKILDENTIAASKETLSKVLTYIKENYNASTYGILLSSHGSGWVPAGYLNNPDTFEELIPISQQPRRLFATYRLLGEDEIPVKTMGVHYLADGRSQEMEIADLADAFPFKMDYVIFDACFMGGIEVAYEMRNATDKIMFSQTEILAEGMDYKTMSSYLFTDNGPDLKGLCQRYYDFYNAKSGVMKSATISLIDCTGLESLATTTRDMLERYSNGLKALQQNRNVQQYYRSSNKGKQQWFYDFGDILEKCGLTEEDKVIFNESLDDVIIYKAATSRFMSDFTIEKHSGLSMYLPFTTGRDYLNSFYKTLEWNKATALVQ